MTAAERFVAKYADRRERDAEAAAARRVREQRSASRKRRAEAMERERLRRLEREKRQARLNCAAHLADLARDRPGFMNDQERRWLMQLLDSLWSIE